MLEQPETTEPKHPWMLVVGALAFLVTTVFSFTFQWQKSSLVERVFELAAQKEATKETTGTEESSVATGTLLQIKDQLQHIEDNQLLWSKIIEKIETTIPKTVDTKKPVAVFRSYRGNDQGTLTVSATTQDDSADPFVDIGRLIRAFSTEPSFKNVFVPSITKNITPTGSVVLSFSLNFIYEKATF